MLRDGATLSQVTRELGRQLNIAHSIVPMSDAPVRTFLETDEGILPMQDYFVRRRSEPPVNQVLYRGAEKAKPSEGFANALEKSGAW